MPPAKTRTFHWRHDVPHSAYLITLAAGEFAMIEERAGNTPVTYYVHPGREDDARRAFRQHAAHDPVLRARDRRALSLRQVCAGRGQRFYLRRNGKYFCDHADRRTLHDARAHLDFKSDPLVAHELAHQWWGDLLTCRDWAHAWLNEGFATYFEALWCEENLGADEFAWNVRQDREGYLDEDTNHYRRPIVCNRYRTPIELFDRHLYEKGSLVLHMLRRITGDELFLQVAQPLLHASSRRQRDHAGPAARVRGHHRTQPRLVLRPVGVQGRASRNRSLEFLRRQEKAAQHHGQADAQAGRHDRGLQVSGDDRADGRERRRSSPSRRDQAARAGFQFCAGRSAQGGALRSRARRS